MSMARLLIFMVIFIILPAASGAESFEELIKAPPLKKAWESLKTNRPSEGIKILSEYQPDTESLAPYHFIYARAMGATQKSLQAIEHLRWAYLYSPKGEMKELSLLERAEAYLKMKYFYEARSDHLVFIKNFPDSKYLGRAHIGLAKSLAGIGLLRDAVKHYEKAGNISEAIFSKANALQGLGRVKEANEAYTSAVFRDSSYVQRSEETLYYFGENLRLMGRLSDARKYLSSVKDASFKDKAEISLGLIAAEESKTDEALKHFRSALLSRDRQVKRRALFNLAEAQTKAGRVDEAKVNLEEIRYKYPYSREYDEVILRLSKLYSKEGKFSGAVSLLKELVFRPSPLREALDEFEAIILDVKGKDTAQFLDLWKSVGPWLLDSSREQFLLKIAEALKNTGRPFLEISVWLSKYGSEAAKTKSLAALASFYAEMGNTNTANEYLRRIKIMKGSGDEILRAEAKIFYAGKDFRSASERLLSIKKIEQGDLNLLGDTLTSAKDVKKAITLYEKAIKETGGNSDVYIRLADILYELGKKTDALNYYRLALNKGPANEWALYRIGTLSDGDEVEEMFKKVGKGNSVLSNLASARLMELNITRKVLETF